MRKPGIIGNQFPVCVAGTSFLRLNEVYTTRLSRCADGNEGFLNQVVLLKMLN